MVIPLVEDWSLREKALHLVISKVVLPICSELIKSYCNEVLGWVISPCADELATLSICDVFTGLDSIIGIDHITFGSI